VGTTTFSLALAWAICTINPPELAVIDRVDVIELNHFYDEQGKLVFDQLLFYDWSPQQSRYNVRAWRLLKSSLQMPQRDWQRGDYSVRWFDGDTLREIRAKTVRETWTQHDPELVEREFLAKEQRRELTKMVQTRRTIEATVAVNKTAAPAAPAATATAAAP
jgi:hypothetical protein